MHGIPRWPRGTRTGSLARTTGEGRRSHSKEKQQWLAGVPRDSTSSSALTQTEPRACRAEGPRHLRHQIPTNAAEWTPWLPSRWKNEVEWERQSRARQNDQTSTLHWWRSRTRRRQDGAWWMRRARPGTQTPNPPRPSSGFHAVVSPNGVHFVGPFPVSIIAIPTALHAKPPPHRVIPQGGTIPSPCTNKGKKTEKLETTPHVCARVLQCKA